MIFLLKLSYLVIKMVKSMLKKKNFKYLAGSEKLDIARQYINQIDKNTVIKNSKELDKLLTAKVAEMYETDLRKK